MASTIASDPPTDDNIADDPLPYLVTLFDPPPDNICELGDITLTILDDARPTIRIKVSSCILATFSKVFKALFRGKFCEGGSEEVVLHEPPRPFKMLCSLLHLQPLDDTPDGPELVELMVLVDKYDCTVPLRSSISCLLDDVAASSNDSVKPGHLVAAAYVADQPVHFRKFTRDLVLCSTLRPDQLDERAVELLHPDLLSEPKCIP